MPASLLLRSSLLASVMLVTSCQWIGERWQAFDESLRLDPLEETSVASGETVSYPNATDVPPPPPAAPTTEAVNRSARVAVLGYHDFTADTKSDNDMVLPARLLRAQMERIRKAGLPVISMEEFLAWRSGEGSLPPFSVLITIDDGWKAVHDIALPIFLEYDVPFTVFLYTDYIESGDRSLTREEIRRILANKGTIGSHSVSHQNLSQQKDRSADDHKAWLNTEFTQSLEVLRADFDEAGSVSNTFAYPFGIYNDLAIAAAREAGYEACFTVNAEKVSWASDRYRLGRYIIQGTDGANFSEAIAFGQAMPAMSPRPSGQNAADEVDERLKVLRPLPYSTIAERLPMISADLSGYENVVPDSIRLQVSGVGQVAAAFDPETSTVSYQTRQPLRREHTQARLQFRHGQSAKTETLLWTFSLDRMAIYEQKALGDMGK